VLLREKRFAAWPSRDEIVRLLRGPFGYSDVVQCLAMIEAPQQTKEWRIRVTLIAPVFRFGFHKNRFFQHRLGFGQVRLSAAGIQPFTMQIPS
jgi:hypothetical protein